MLVTSYLPEEFTLVKLFAEWRKACLVCKQDSEAQKDATSGDGLVVSSGKETEARFILYTIIIITVMTFIQAWFFP